MFSFGAGCRGADAPQLGHGSAIPHVYSPRLVEGLGVHKAAGVAAGGCHSVVHTEAGEVFTFGEGYRGVLGHGTQEDEAVPRLVEGLAEEKVVATAAGRGGFGNHTVVCTEGGAVFTFGAWGRGKLGHGSNQGLGIDHLSEPRRVSGLYGRVVVGVAAGGEHTVVVLKGGWVFSCGKGGDGQLGTGALQDEYVPTLVETLAGKNVVNLAAGWDSTVVCTKAGEVLAFGNNFSGQLGLGSSYQHYEVDVCSSSYLEQHYEAEAKCKQPTPKLVEGGLKGKKVRHVAVGKSHLVACAESGELFTCGDQTAGKLG